MLERYPNQTKEFHFNIWTWAYVSIEDGAAVDMIAFVLGRIQFFWLSQLCELKTKHRKNVAIHSCACECVHCAYINAFMQRSLHVLCWDFREEKQRNEETK